MAEPPDRPFCTALFTATLGAGLNNRQWGRRPGPRRSGGGESRAGQSRVAVIPRGGGTVPSAPGDLGPYRVCSM